MSSDLRAVFNRLIDTRGVLERLDEGKRWLSGELRPFRPTFQVRPFWSCDEDVGLSSCVEMIVAVDAAIARSELAEVTGRIDDWIADSASAEVRSGIVIQIERRAVGGV